MAKHQPSLGSGSGWPSKVWSKLDCSSTFISQWNALPNGASLRQQSHENRASDFFCFLPFFLAVRGVLQVGENELTAMDAFWLGLIDTVRADLGAFSAGASATDAAPGAA